MNKTVNLNLPCDCRGLNAGDVVYLSGVIYTARDAAHKRMSENPSAMPFDVKNAAIFYCGPTPAREGEVIGSCGPTTSTRMDPFTPALYDMGLKITIGKGKRSKEVVEAIKRNGGIYLIAVGGAAALMKQCVLSKETVAYPELGCEAVYRLTVKDMPLIVAIDSNGNSILK